MCLKSYPLVAPLCHINSLCILYIRNIIGYTPPLGLRSRHRENWRVRQIFLVFGLKRKLFFFNAYIFRNGAITMAASPR